MENKTGKYFKYAIGEIVLVVIGILIALQINNWNENRKVQALEKDYLIGLKKEFEYNLEELEYYININERSMNAISEIFKLSGPNANIDTINYDKYHKLIITAIGYSLQYDISSGVLEDLISSGNLNTLSNESLKASISQWKQLLKQIQRNQEKSLDTRNFIFGNFSLFDGRNMMPLYMDEPSGKSKFKNTSLLFLKDKSYENKLASYKGTSFYIQKYGYLPLKEINLKIIDIINQDIENND